MSKATKGFHSFWTFTNQRPALGADLLSSDTVTFDMLGEETSS